MVKSNKQAWAKKFSNDNFLEIFKNSSAAQNKAQDKALNKQWPYEEAPFRGEEYLRHLFAGNVRRSEKEIFNSRGREVKKQTEALLVEIKKELAELKKSGAVYKKEVEKAVERPPPQPSQYYVSFLEHIKRILVDLRREIENSSSWLAAWNQRQQKKGFFWGTFLNQKRGGVQFLLSSEHYMTRSAG